MEAKAVKTMIKKTSYEVSYFARTNHATLSRKAWGSSFCRILMMAGKAWFRAIPELIRSAAKVSHFPEGARRHIFNLAPPVISSASTAFPELPHKNVTHSCSSRHGTYLCPCYCTVACSKALLHDGPDGNLSTGAVPMPVSRR